MKTWSAGEFSILKSEKRSLSNPTCQSYKRQGGVKGSLKVYASGRLNYVELNYDVYFTFFASSFFLSSFLPSAAVSSS